MIPKEFELFGEKHKVSKVKKIDTHGSEGEWDPNKNRIKLLSTLPQDRMEQRYYHELVHCILDHLQYAELSSDEEFVDIFGKALHQIIKTSK
jgi:hypothetical protein